MVQFEYGKKRDKSDSSLSHVCEKEEGEKEVDKTISDLPRSEKNELLIIDWDPVFEGYGTFGKGINLSIFYFCVFLSRYW